MYPKSERPNNLILPAGTLSYRVQRAQPMRTTIRISGFHLAPVSARAGRFDVVNESVAYMASSRRTALLESVFRRQVTHRTLHELATKNLVTVKTQRDLLLVDLRGFEINFPFLVHNRYEKTRELAEVWRSQGYNGIVYASAQNPGQDCIAFFESGIRASKVVAKQRLVINDQPLLAVIDAAQRAAVPLI